MNQKLCGDLLFMHNIPNLTWEAFHIWGDTVAQTLLGDLYAKELNGSMAKLPGKSTMVGTYLFGTVHGTLTSF